MKKITESILVLAVTAIALMSCSSDNDEVSNTPSYGNDSRSRLQSELDESGETLLGDWNLEYNSNQRSGGRMITFNDDGSCIVTIGEGDQAIRVNYAYSIHKEEGYIPSFNGQSLHYYYYLRLLPSPDEDNGWIDTDWGMVVHGNYLYLTLIHRRYFIIDQHVYKRAGTEDDESVIILNGTWNLTESHEGEAKAEESITFDDKATCIRTDSLGNKIYGGYSIHEEEGEMYTIHDNLLHYKYYLRLQEHIGDDDVTRDWGIFFDGARIFFTPIHENNEEGEFYIYMREDHEDYGYSDLLIGSGDQGDKDLGF